MTTLQEAAKQALGALEHIQRCIGFATATIHQGSATWCQSEDAIASIKAALAQQRESPVMPNDEVICEALIQCSDVDGIAYDPQSFEAGHMRGKVDALDEIDEPSAQQEPVATVYSFNDLGGTFDWVSPPNYRPPVGAKLFAAAPAPVEQRCTYCDGTGDVHSIDGEWRGTCHCAAAPAPQAQEPTAWRTEALKWIRRKAEDQRATNEQNPRHAEAYPSWGERVRNWHWLADELELEQNSTSFGLDPYQEPAPQPAQGESVVWKVVTFSTVKRPRVF